MGPARPLRHVRGPRGQNSGWNICSLPRCPTISPSYLPCLGPRLNMDGAVRSSAPAATAISKLVKRRERLPQPFGTHRNVHTIPLCKLVSIIQKPLHFYSGQGRQSAVTTSHRWLQTIINQKICFQITTFQIPLSPKMPIYSSKKQNIQRYRIID